MFQWLHLKECEKTPPLRGELLRNGNVLRLHRQLEHAPRIRELMRDLPALVTVLDLSYSMSRHYEFMWELLTLMHQDVAGSMGQAWVIFFGKDALPPMDLGDPDLLGVVRHLFQTGGDVPEFDRRGTNYHNVMVHLLAMLAPEGQLCGRTVKVVFQTDGGSQEKLWKTDIVRLKPLVASLEPIFFCTGSTFHELEHMAHASTVVVAKDRHTLSQHMSALLALCCGYLEVGLTTGQTTTVPVRADAETLTLELLNASREPAVGLATATWVTEDGGHTDLTEELRADPCDLVPSDEMPSPALLLAVFRADAPPEKTEVRDVLALLGAQSTDPRIAEVQQEFAVMASSTGSVLLPAQLSVLPALHRKLVAACSAQISGKIARKQRQAAASLTQMVQAETIRARCARVRQLQEMCRPAVFPPYNCRLLFAPTELGWVLPVTSAGLRRHCTSFRVDLTPEQTQLLLNATTGLLLAGDLCSQESTTGLQAANQQYVNGMPELGLPVVDPAAPDADQYMAELGALICGMAVVGVPAGKTRTPDLLLSTLANAWNLRTGTKNAAAIVVAHYAAAYLRNTTVAVAATGTAETTPGGTIVRGAERFPATGTVGGHSYVKLDAATLAVQGPLPPGPVHLDTWLSQHLGTPRATLWAMAQGYGKFPALNARKHSMAPGGDALLQTAAVAFAAQCLALPDMAAFRQLGQRFLFDALTQAATAAWREKTKAALVAQLELEPTLWVVPLEQLLAALGTADFSRVLRRSTYATPLPLPTSALQGAAELALGTGAPRPSAYTAQGYYSQDATHTILLTAAVLTLHPPPLEGGLPSPAWLQALETHVETQLGREAGEAWCDDDHAPLAPTWRELWPDGPPWAAVTAAVLFNRSALPGPTLGPELLREHLGQPAAHQQLQHERQLAALEALRLHLVAHPDAAKAAAWMEHAIALQDRTAFPTDTGLAVSAEMWERLPLAFCTEELQTYFAEQGAEVELRGTPQPLPTPGSHHFHARMQKHLCGLPAGDVTFPRGPKPRAPHQFRNMDLADLAAVPTSAAREALRRLILQHGALRLVWSYENRWMVRTIGGKDAGSARMAATYPL